jgi:hypothetical protein
LFNIDLISTCFTITYTPSQAIGKGAIYKHLKKVRSCSPLAPFADDKRRAAIVNNRQITVIYDNQQHFPGVQKRMNTYGEQAGCSAGEETLKFPDSSVSTST